MAISPATEAARQRLHEQSPEEKEKLQEQNDRLQKKVKENFPEAVGGLASLAVPGLAGLAVGGAITGAIENVQEAKREHRNQLKAAIVGAAKGIPVVGEGLEAISDIRHGEPVKEALKEAAKDSLKDLVCAGKREIFRR